MSLQDGQHIVLILGIFCVALPNRFAQPLSQEFAYLKTRTAFLSLTAQMVQP